MKPTLEEFLRSKMTFVDHLCWYSWVLFLAVLGLYMTLLGLKIQFDHNVAAMLLFWAFVIVATSRTVLANRVKRRKEEYERRYEL